MSRRRSTTQGMRQQRKMGLETRRVSKGRDAKGTAQIHPHPVGTAAKQHVCHIADDIPALSAPRARANEQRIEWYQPAEGLNDEETTRAAAPPLVCHRPAAIRRSLTGGSRGRLAIVLKSFEMSSLASALKAAEREKRRRLKDKAGRKNRSVQRDVATKRRHSPVGSRG